MTEVDFHMRTDGFGAMGATLHTMKAFSHSTPIKMLSIGHTC